MLVNLTFVNNFYVWLTSCLLSNNAQNNTPFTSSSTGSAYPFYEITNEGGFAWAANQFITTTDIMLANIRPAYVNNTDCTYFRLGTGGATETNGSTYTVATPYDDCSYTWSGVHYREDVEGAKHGSLDITLTITNNGANDVSLNEIGLYRACKRTSAVYMEKLLMARGTFVDEPLEIAAGASKSLVVHLTSPIPISA